MGENFQIPEIQAVLSSFFCKGNDIACGSDGDGGWAQYGSIKCSTKTIESQRSNLGSCGPCLCSQHSKLKMEDIG